ncbi:MAG: hypothetical protein M1816_002681 [Peltula sp. TS41687]|nr:MAG: hypothetical protein M1816_002681 [Peltula sp. TS41687]
MASHTSARMHRTEAQDPPRCCLEMLPVELFLMIVRPLLRCSESIALVPGGPPRSQHSQHVVAQFSEADMEVQLLCVSKLFRDRCRSVLFGENTFASVPSDIGDPSYGILHLSSIKTLHLDFSEAWTMTHMPHQDDRWFQQILEGSMLYARSCRFKRFKNLARLTLSYTSSRTLQTSQVQDMAWVFATNAPLSNQVTCKLVGHAVSQLHSDLWTSTCRDVWSSREGNFRPITVLLGPSGFVYPCSSSQSGSLLNFPIGRLDQSVTTGYLLRRDSRCSMMTGWREVPHVSDVSPEIQAPSLATQASAKRRTPANDNQASTSNRKRRRAS